MSIAIAIFVKTPGLSSIKTRLAKDIGTEKAAKFYQLAVQASKSLAKNIQIKEFQTNFYWAIAEVDGVGNQLWSDELTVFQESGGLGERLNHVYNELYSKNKITAFMGSDSPHISSSYLSEKLEEFEKSEKSFLIGPAHDGGFYFFASKVGIPSKAWLDVNYSTQTTLDELVSGLETLGEIEYLEPDFDVDDRESLIKLKSVPTTSMTGQQKLLIENLSELL
jgi:glycosyltransferase A (GT-A) superfamily protein (DUF2064 family)